MINDSSGCPDANFSVIKISDRYEVRRWCQRFICTEAQLRLAVAEVGSNPAKVRQLIDERR